MKYFYVLYVYSTPPTTSFASNVPSVAHDNAHHGVRMDPENLPLYEELIDKALEVCADPEGAPPNNMLLWRHAHYPLLHNDFLAVREPGQLNNNKPEK